MVQIALIDTALSGLRAILATMTVSQTSVAQVVHFSGVPPLLHGHLLETVAVHYVMTTSTNNTLFITGSGKSI